MFWEIYVALCRGRGMSANAVARELSIASGTVTEWKKGRQPQNATLRRLSEYFGVSVDELTGEQSPASLAACGIAKSGVRVRVYDEILRGELLEIASTGSDCAISAQAEEGTPMIGAGIPLSMIEDCENYEEISAETARDGAFVALRLSDDCMEPRMVAGDVVIVRLCDTAQDGDTVVAYVEGRAICRRVKKTAEGMLLLATNLQCEPIFCSQAQLESGEIRLLGRVIELRAKY